MHRAGPAELAPHAHRVLHAVDRKWRHRHRDGDKETARHAQVSLEPEIVARNREDGGVDDGRRGQRPAAHGGEGERREQTHGGDDDQRTRIPEEMREIEHRRGTIRWRSSGGAGAEKIEERVELFSVECARGHRGAQVLVVELHRILRQWPVTRAT